MCLKYQFFLLSWYETVLIGGNTFFFLGCDHRPKQPNQQIRKKNHSFKIGNLCSFGSVCEYFVVFVRDRDKKKLNYVKYILIYLFGLGMEMEQQISFDRIDIDFSFVFNLCQNPDKNSSTRTHAMACHTIMSIYV